LVAEDLAGMKGKANILISASLTMGVCLMLLASCEEVEPTLEPNITISTVEIPVGTFIMGSPTNEPNRKEDEIEHVVTLSGFRMSMHEITNAEYVTFLNAKKVDRYGHYPKGEELTENLVRVNTSWGVWYSNNQWVPVEGYEDHPVIDVTWFGQTSLRSMQVVACQRRPNGSMPAVLIRQHHSIPEGV
jgi:formylglycine-generating enzyme required for sulfatase activity